MKTADEWEKLGVRVQRRAYGLSPEEREDSISCLHTEQDAEVSTTRRTWQRSLEGLGCQPASIQTFKGTTVEFRWYTVPKAWVRVPLRPGKAGGVPYTQKI